MAKIPMHERLTVDEAVKTMRERHGLKADEVVSNKVDRTENPELAFFWERVLSRFCEVD